MAYVIEGGDGIHPLWWAEDHEKNTITLGVPCLEEDSVLVLVMATTNDKRSMLPVWYMGPVVS